MDPTVYDYLSEYFVELSEIFKGRKKNLNTIVLCTPHQKGILSHVFL